MRFRLTVPSAARSIGIMLLMMPFAFNPISAFAYEHPLRTFVILGVCVVGVLAVWQGVRDGFIELLTIPYPKTAITLVALIAASIVISTAASSNPLHAVWGSITRHQGIVWVLTLGLLTLLGLLTTKLQHLHWLARAFVIGGTIAAVIGLLQFAYLDPFARPNRIYGWTGHPNILAAYLCMTAAASLLLAAYTKQKRWWAHWLVQVTVIFLTFTRTAWALLLVQTLGQLCIVAYAWAPQWKRFGLYVLTAAVCLLLSIGLAAGLVQNRSYQYALFSSVAPLGLVLQDAAQNESTVNPLLLRAQSAADVGAGSMGIRVHLYRDARGLLEQHWLLGIGAENLLFEYPKYYRDDPTRPAIAQRVIADRFHSDPIDTLGQYGIVGLIGWYGLYIYLCVVAVRTMVRAKHHAPTLAGASYTHAPGAQAYTQPQLQYFGAAIGLSMLVSYTLFNLVNFSTLLTQVSFVAAILLILVAAGGDVQTNARMRIPRGFASRPRRVLLVVSIIAVACGLRFAIAPEFATVYGALGQDASITEDERIQAFQSAADLAPEIGYFSYNLAETYFRLALSTDNTEAKAEYFALADAAFQQARERGFRGVFLDQRISQLYREWALIDPTLAPDAERTTRELNATYPVFLKD